MKARRVKAVLVGLILSLAGTGAAQTIQWPRLGQPAITMPGAVLELSATHEGALSLEQAGQSTSLEVHWTKAGGGSFRGRAVLPASLQPGVYALQLAAEKGAANNPAAVHVMNAIPEDYAFAILRGAESPAGVAPVPAIPVDLAAQLKAASVQFAIILGPLTRGSEEEYRALEQLLLASEVPVYLCPARSDLRSPAFADSPLRGVAFGKDGYLFLGAGLFADDPQTAARTGAAYLARRALRASRWSVGVAGEYGLDWDLRAQEVLFVDDPLNLLVAGFSSPPLPELGVAVPWGKTALLPTADVPRGALSVFEVTASGIKPRMSAAAPAPTNQEEAAGK